MVTNYFSTSTNEFHFRPFRTKVHVWYYVSILMEETYCFCPVCLSICDVSSIKGYAQLHLYFKLKFLKTLHVCSLPYEKSHIITAFWLYFFFVWKYCSLRKKFISTKPVSSLYLYWLSAPKKWGRHYKTEKLLKVIINPN